MRRAFPWLFNNYLVGFFLFLAAQSLVLGFGMRFALDSYSRFQRKKLSDLATAILVDPRSVDLAYLEVESSFFVFSADRQLVFSNRGKAKAISEKDYFPVDYRGATIGYYYAGDLRFGDSEANRIFLSSLLILVVASVFISLVVGFTFAIFSSKRIAMPVAQITGDIRKIRLLKMVPARKFTISEMSEISDALQSLSKILASEEEYKRQWMQDIAHDLRTPISGLKGQLEGMRDGVLEPSADRFDKNLNEIERLESLVKAISDLYRMETLRNLQYCAFQTEDFVRELLAPHELILKEKRLKLDMQICADTISGQRDLLLRGVGNIVDNAFSYVRENGRIGIEIRKSEGYVLIRISDDGPGISNDQLDKVFNRFYRGDYARKTPGNGLGLNIAKEIIQRHGGTISIDNTHLKGVAFSVSLPVTS